MRSEILRRRSTPLVMLVVVGLTLTLAASAWAGPRCGMMGGPNVTPEQAGQSFDLRQKFMNETAGLRKEMAVKRAEMMAMWNTDKPDEAKILAKKKELNALRDKLQEKAVAMGLEMKKISPGGPACPMGMGGGMGMGPGGGMGHGCPY